ncbi:ABC transporter ATP-binding protein [Roseovarius arcticus]|uniref:ABC transporter ATP-binding protein n=1 Tax=Roseovarius arcticus TaxID=2547404 RepID=UPI0011108011|nr:ABC transporter ATP-binding protein [Roseovarius arcticus]
MTRSTASGTDAPTVNALETRNLGVTYGKFVALAEVDLNVRENSVHSIIGPNGAGKTTMFHALTGTLKPSSGTVTLNGRDITRASDTERVQRGLARSFQVTSLFPDLDVRENLRLAAQGRTPWQALALWRWPESNKRVMAIADEMIERLSLNDVAHRAAGELSHGQQRRLEVGMAMAAKPSVILMDEPTSGMGIDDIEEMKALIRSLGRDHTVLFIEHNMGIVMNISDTVTVMKLGRTLVEGPPSVVRDDPEVKAAYLGNMLTGDMA